VWRRRACTIDLDVDAQPEWCASRKAIARGDLVPFVDASADTAPPARKPRGSKGGTLAITAQPDEAPEVEPEGFPLTS
jgi:hypothetical protein